VARPLGGAVKAVPAVLVDAVVWAGWGTVVGAVAARTTDARFRADGPITRIRGWERQGRVWERVGVRRWKLGVPDFGPLFGGTSKRRLGSRSPDRLEQILVETRRAEVVHWIAPLPLLVMPLWNPAWLTAVMFAYAFGANAPCVLIQRHNRARLQRILGSAGRPAGSTS
jgi:glycosyl-4,4'-diaponeurosporenoate acyltransferase